MKKLFKILKGITVITDFFIESAIFLVVVLVTGYYLISYFYPETTWSQFNVSVILTLILFRICLFLCNYLNKKKLPAPKIAISRNPLYISHYGKWQSFRDAGMLFFINNILHAFGWAICVVTDEETKEIVRCYPERVKFRGFPEDAQAEEHIKIAKYLAENAHEFVEDVKS